MRHVARKWCAQGLSAQGHGVARGRRCTRAQPRRGTGMLRGTGRTWHMLGTGWPHSLHTCPAVGWGTMSPPRPQPGTAASRLLHHEKGKLRQGEAEGPPIRAPSVSPAPYPGLGPHRCPTRVAGEGLTLVPVTPRVITALCHPRALLPPTGPPARLYPRGTVGWVLGGPPPQLWSGGHRDGVDGWTDGWVGGQI